MPPSAAGHRHRSPAAAITSPPRSLTPVKTQLGRAGRRHLRAASHSTQGRTRPARRTRYSHRRRGRLLRHPANREHAPNPTATRRDAGQRPARTPPAKPTRQTSKPGTRRQQDGTLAGTHRSASRQRPNPAERKQPIPPRHRLTGATRFSARPASRGNPHRAGPATPPFTGRPSPATPTPKPNSASRTHRSADLHHVLDV